MNLFTDLNQIENIPGVYLIKCKEHIYIGSSMRLKSRLRDHITRMKSREHSNKNLKYCYRKYKKEDFSLEILEYFIPGTDERIVREAEHKYLEEYSPDMNVMKSSKNSICSPNGKKVYQYTLDGEFVAEHKSGEDANLKFGVTNIQAVCNPNNRTRSTAGFQWSYEKHDRIEPYINLSDKARIKGVGIHDISGKQLEYFDSIADCVRKYFSDHQNSFDSLCATISSCASGKQCSFEGYRFSYEDLKQLDDAELKKFKKSFPIVQYDHQGNFLKIWNDIKEASKSLGIEHTTIQASIRKSVKRGVPSKCKNFKFKKLGS